MAKSKLCFEEMEGGEKKAERQREEDSKIQRDAKVVEKYSELPKQMYSNTLFDTCSLRTLLTYSRQMYLSVTESQLEL